MQSRAKLLQEDLIAFRARAAELVGDQTWESAAISVIPHREGRIVPLDPEQRSAFERHLRAVALAASSADETPINDDDDADPLDQEHAQGPMRGIAAAVCSACRGFCCYHGNDKKAFIEVLTLQRYARAHASVNPEDVVSAYLAHVPQRHFEGSCVYHTAVGCSLPRAMRSAICNGYMCSGLQSALQTKVDDPSERRFVVVRHDNEIVRAVLIDERGSREVVDTAEQTNDT